ncbi:hypothetical protein Tco_1219573 [Tanacetum coccineum]
MTKGKLPFILCSGGKMRCNLAMTLFGLSCVNLNPFLENFFGRGQCPLFDHKIALLPVKRTSIDVFTSLHICSKYGRGKFQRIRQRPRSHPCEGLPLSFPTWRESMAQHTPLGTCPVALIIERHARNGIDALGIGVTQEQHWAQIWNYETGLNFVTRKSPERPEVVLTLVLDELLVIDSEDLIGRGSNPGGLIDLDHREVVYPELGLVEYWPAAAWDHLLLDIDLVNVLALLTWTGLCFDRIDLPPKLAQLWVQPLVLGRKLGFGSFLARINAPIHVFESHANSD